MEKCQLIFSLDELFADIVPAILFGTESGLEEVRKEKQTEKEEKNNKFDDNDNPELPSHSH